MRRGYVIALAVFLLLAGIAIGVGAYHAGVVHGVATSASGEVVHVVGPAYGYGAGFFPFGLFLFPLFFFGLIFLVRGAFWGRRWYGYGPDHPKNGAWGGPGGGPAGGTGAARFEEWHRKQHEGAATGHGSGAEPSGP